VRHTLHAVRRPQSVGRKRVEIAFGYRHEQNSRDETVRVVPGAAAAAAVMMVVIVVYLHGGFEQIQNGQRCIGFVQREIINITLGKRRYYIIKHKTYTNPLICRTRLDREVKQSYIIVRFQTRYAVHYIIRVDESFERVRIGKKQFSKLFRTHNSNASRILRLVFVKFGNSDVFENYITQSYAQSAQTYKNLRRYKFVTQETDYICIRCFFREVPSRNFRVEHHLIL